MFPPCGAGKQVGCICCVSLKPKRSIWGNGGWSLLSAMTVFPLGNKKGTEIKPCVKFQSLSLFVSLTNLLSLSYLLTPHTKIQTSLISMKENINATGVIHTSQELYVRVSLMPGLNTQSSISQLHPWLNHFKGSRRPICKLLNLKLNLNTFKYKCVSWSILQEMLKLKSIWPFHLVWRTRKKQTVSAGYLIFSHQSVEQIEKSYQSSLADVVQPKRKWPFEYHLSDYLCHSMLSSGTLCCLHWVMRLFFSLSDQWKAHIMSYPDRFPLYILWIFLLLQSNGGQPTNADHCFSEGTRVREGQTDRDEERQRSNCRRW